MRMRDLLTYTLQVIYWPLYFGLTGVGFLFVQNTFREFLDHKTAFHTDSASLMTAKDIPTFTICFEFQRRLKYKPNMSIGMMMEWIDTKNDHLNYTIMVEGENPITDMFGVTHYLKLQSLNVRQNIPWSHRRCVKVSPMEQELESDLKSTIPGYAFHET